MTRSCPARGFLTAEVRSAPARRRQWECAAATLAMIVAVPSSSPDARSRSGARAASRAWLTACEAADRDVAIARAARRYSWPRPRASRSTAARGAAPDRASTSTTSPARAPTTRCSAILRKLDASAATAASRPGPTSSPCWRRGEAAPPRLAGPRGPARRRRWRASPIGGAPDQDAETPRAARRARDAIDDTLTPHQREVLVAITLDDVPIDVLAERLDDSRPQNSRSTETHSDHSADSPSAAAARPVR